MILPLMISGAEITIILLIVVMLFGSNKVPEIAHFLGKSMRSVRNATDDIKTELTRSYDEEQINKAKASFTEQTDEVKKELADLSDSVKKKEAFTEQAKEVKKGVDKIGKSISRSK
ncbi:MAG: twin-arginine translocase TatA/TatE family subunit [Psychroflexus sp.]|jgi:sec-independent protein translocase protein TatA|nr:twin-arginine translocase TatA/TatE family subunit [Psychroflexus sp.]MDR9448122.1 twin-arginine translocase TatA/TatE family subunit [Psychroflexus sp.]